MLSTLAQSHLSLLALCPRRFQHHYLDRVVSPIPWFQQQRITWGNQFHQLLQQYELGLPLQRFQASNPDLYRCFTALHAAAPHIFQPPDGQQPHAPRWRASEHRRTLAFGNYGLTVVYDWILATDRGVEIFDWKTYRQPPKADTLAHHWQTRLYAYVLAETSNYEPEQITFSYWFIAPPRPGEPVELGSQSFAYDRHQHAATHQDLQTLVHQFQGWHDRYTTQGEAFPQVTLGNSICDTCSFQQRCQRGSGNASDGDRPGTLWHDLAPLADPLSDSVAPLLAIETIPPLPFPDPDPDSANPVKPTQFPPPKTSNLESV